jgi:hypothetical protein
MGQTADDAVEGFACSHCGTYFEEPHGYPVLCKGCHAESDSELPQATNAELG